MNFLIKFPRPRGVEKVAQGELQTSDRARVQMQSYSRVCYAILPIYMYCQTALSVLGDRQI